MLGDIATLTGGTLISEDLGIKLENVELSHLGTVSRTITIDKDETTIVEGAGKPADVQARVQQIRNQLGGYRKRIRSRKTSGATGKTDRWCSDRICRCWNRS